MKFKAVTVKIQRKNGTVETHELSLGGGPLITETDELFHGILTRYSLDDLHMIKEVNKVQDFLVCSGYSLSNVILLEVSELYITS